MNIGKIVLVTGSGVVTGFAVRRAVEAVVRKISPKLVEDPDSHANAQDILLYLWVAIMIAIIAAGSEEFVKDAIQNRFYPES